MFRPSKEVYYLNIAKEVSKRGTCLRRRFGAIIVNHDQVISTGYVGAPRGAKNCSDLGDCPREKANIPAGERYELCRSVHAEMNCIIHASREQMLDGTMYLYGENLHDQSVVGGKPCKLCRRMIINAGLAEVIVATGNDQFHLYKVKEWIDQELTDFTQEDIKGY